MPQGKKSNKQAQKPLGRMLAIVVSMLIAVILVPIIVANTILIVGSYTDSEHIPSIAGISPLVVVSGSMEGTFSTNALIFIRDIDTEELEIGDVICYLIDEVAITHRITQITEDEAGEIVYITQGDANNTEDNYYVYPEQIEGLYIGHIEEIGAFILFMQTTSGVIIFVGLPIVLYLILDYILSRREKKTDDKRAKELEEELAELKKQLQS